jgi:Predicted hydrolases or acyltransferases (alpha/beta hydrolase superfamily)
MRTRSEVIVWANGVQLCAETFGDRADPAVVLIMGSSASMEWWEDEFCEMLASGGRFVIRYDLRDTGRSITYPPGSPAYTGRDLVDDLGALIDVLVPGRAHLVGMSMGGGIAQRFALDHPDRVASLTVFASTFADRDLSRLPSMSQETGRRFGAVPSPDWADRAETAGYVVELARVGAATSAHFDEAPVRSIAERAFDRSTDMEASYTNHDLLEDGAPSARRLEDLSTPTLVVHGTEDPVFPYEHAIALSQTIPAARLLPLEGTGHELPRRTWDIMVPAILRHTAEMEMD